MDFGGFWRIWDGFGGFWRFCRILGILEEILKDFEGFWKETEGDIGRHRETEGHFQPPLSHFVGLGVKNT